MNKVIPLSILTCDCCASTGFIRTCKLKNCDYKMCLKCRTKYYVEGQHLQCPACRRNINKGSNCIFFLPTYFQFFYKCWKSQFPHKKNIEKKKKSNYQNPNCNVLHFEYEIEVDEKILKELQESLH